MIPSLLGGPDNLMIGRVLWDEFFGNHDWPVASAVAIAFLVLLVGPIALYQYYNGGSSRLRVEEPLSPLLLSVLCIGIAILYLPILVLIGYSFNASPLVSVWGGFSTTWYAQLIHNHQILDAALLSLKVASPPPRARSSSARWRRFRWCASRFSAAGCCSPAWSTRRW